MNISKIKSLLASVEFDILDNKSMATESLANSLIEEKSISTSLNKIDDPIQKMSSRISSALTNGNQEPKNSIHYGYLAIGAIIGAKDSDYLSDRISFLISKSILSNKDAFSSLTSIDKIAKVNESYYRLIPLIKQTEIGKDRNQRSEIKMSVFKKIGKTLEQEKINTNFVDYAIDEINKEAKRNNEFALSNSSFSTPNISMKK